MKDLGIYFSSFGDNSMCSANQLGRYMHVNSESDFYSPGKFEIALLFVPEYRNSNLSSDKELIDAVRRNLYALYPGEWRTSFTDLGTIMPGSTVEDTYTAVKDVIQELVKSNVFPIVVGGGAGSDLCYV